MEYLKIRQQTHNPESEGRWHPEDPTCDLHAVTQQCKSLQHCQSKSTHTQKRFSVISFISTKSSHSFTRQQDNRMAATGSEQRTEEPLC